MEKENDLAEIGGNLSDLVSEIAVNPVCAAYVWNRRLALRTMQTSLKKVLDALDGIYTPAAV